MTTAKLGNVTREKNGYQVVFTRVFEHPVEKVWNAITKPEELKFWFTDIEMDFRIGGKMTVIFRDEAKSRSEGEIIEIDPPHRFVWSWETELAVWELQALDSRSTQLVFTYSKLDETYATSAPAGFHWFLDKLKERLNGSEKQYPFGAQDDPEQQKLNVHYAAHIYNAYPEAVKDKPVVVSQTLRAPIERVWRALTDPRQMKEWYFHVDGFRPEPGFQFSFPGQGHKGEEYIHLCTVTAVDEPHLLQYSWTYKGIPGYSLVTFHLSMEGEGTVVKLTHHGLGSFPQDSDDFAASSFTEGWKWIVQKSLPEYLEKGKMEGSN